MYTNKVVTQALRVLLAVGLLASLEGCGTIGVPLTGGGTTPGYSYLTGNWQMTVTNTPGSTTFSSFAGWILEQQGSADTSHQLTGAFQVVPESCYLGSTTVPATGIVQATSVQFRSFSVNGQYLQLTATKDATATQLTGTYQVSGGCANGEQGTFTATRYAPLTGTYAGPIGSQGVSLFLTQTTNADGNGYTELSGSADFTGLACFTSGTLASTSSVIGSAVHLEVNSPGGDVVTIDGTFDPAAGTISVTSGSISGGACAASFGASTLPKSEVKH